MDVLLKFWFPKVLSIRISLSMIKPTDILLNGDKFQHKTGTVYTLQKLPDFELWILVGEPKDHRDRTRPTSWMGINDDSTTALGSFGNCENDFIKL